jgi:hypothetical protein
MGLYAPIRIVIYLQIFRMQSKRFAILAKCVMFDLIQMK